MILPPDPQVKLTTLANGLRVVSERMDHLATASVGIWIAAGARHEHRDEHGLAHLIEHMAFKGTATRTARQIAEEIENVGGDLNAETTAEVTSYFARVLGEDLPLALDLIGDIVTNPAFAADELEREKQVILQEIGSYEDAPDELIFDLFMEQGFPDTVLGRPILGTPDSVMALSEGSMRTFLARQYRAPAMVVAAAGAVDHEALVAQAERLFAGLSPLQPEQAVTCAYRGGDVRQKRKLEQVHLVMGAEGVSFHDPLHEAMHVFAQVLGGGLSSRLFQELREKRGLCYDVHAFFTPFSDTGIFGIYGGTGGKDAGQFTSVMIDQLRQAALQLEPAEIARAKAQIKVGMLAARESPTRRADQMARQLLAFGRVPSGQELSRRIESVNHDSLKQAANRLLQGQPTFAVIGPHTGLPDVKRLKTDFVPL